MLASERPPAVVSSPLARRMGQTAGILLLVVVTAGYVMSLRMGTWPPSHPWSGITLTTLALLHLGMPGRSDGAHRVLLGLAIALGVAASLLWLAAAWTQVSP